MSLRNGTLTFNHEPVLILDFTKTTANQPSTRRCKASYPQSVSFATDSLCCDSNGLSSLPHSGAGTATRDPFAGGFDSFLESEKQFKNPHLKDVGCWLDDYLQSSLPSALNPP
jgi:hypothetical protein